MNELILTTPEQLTEIIRAEIKSALKDAQTDTPVPAPRERNYTSKDLQTMFNISATSVWNWERAGILKPVIVSRRKMYLKEDIDALIQQKQMKQRK